MFSNASVFGQRKKMGWDFVYTMQILVSFNHVPSSSPVPEQWQLSDFSLSWYGNSLSAGKIIVARCCTASNFSISPLRYGDHTRFPYSNSGRTSALYSRARFCLSRYVYDLLIMPKVEFALFTTLFIWSYLNHNSLSTHMPRYFLP